MSFFFFQYCAALTQAILAEMIGDLAKNTSHSLFPTSVISHDSVQSFVLFFLCMQGSSGL